VTAGNRNGQIVLRDGDSVQIPSATEEPIYIMGEVVRPGSQPLVHGSLSLARAISEAGGIQVASADATSIYVIRSGGSINAVDVFHLDARNPASMVLADKFALNPRDIVYVDAGSLVRFSRVMNLLVPTISAVAGTVSSGAQVYYIKKTY
jgi:polysaccharide export outer membrane protein